MAKNQNAGAVADRPGFAPLEKTGTLFPLLLLDVGGSVDLVLQNVSIVPGKKRGDVRCYYVGKLLADAKGKTTRKDAEGKSETIAAEFSEGDVISLPGTGGLDYNMGKLAFKWAKVAGNPSKEKDFDKIPWTDLYGDRFHVTRTSDEEMKKGDFAGEMAKAFEIQHGRRQGK